MGRKKAAKAPPVRRVLVVDDDTLVAEVTARLLASIGQVIVERAHDGPSAVRLAGEFKPDIVFLDLVMPGMDGLEVARQLRAMAHIKRPKIVALTAFRQPAFQDAASAAGFDGYLTKPPSAEDLAKALAA